MSEFPRLKDLGRWLSGGTPPKDDEASWIGDVPWISAKDIASTQLRVPTTWITREAAARHSRLVGPGTILIIVRGMALAHGLPVVRTDSEVAFNQDLRALVPRPGIDARYLHYALIGNRERFAPHLDKAAHGTTRVIDSIYTERIWLPGQDEQRAIADFLDHEVERVGVLMDSLRLASDVAQEAVLGEADGAIFGSDAPTPRVGHLFNHVSGKTLNARTAERSGKEASFIGTWNVRWGEVLFTNYKAAPFTPAERQRYKLLAGDLLVNEGGAYSGRAAVLQHDLPGVHFQNHVHRLRSLGKAEPEYFRWALQVMANRGELLLDSLGIGLPNLSAARLKSIRVPMPSRDTQRDICKRLGRKEKVAGELQRTSTAMVDKLRVYRDSLITEVVTGQFDISQVSAREMDEGAHAALEGSPA